MSKENAPRASVDRKCPFCQSRDIDLLWDVSEEGEFEQAFLKISEKFVLCVGVCHNCHEFFGVIIYTDDAEDKEKGELTDQD